MKDVRTIRVQTATSSYDVFLSKNELFSSKRHQKALFSETGNSTFIITSPEIWALWSSRILAVYRGKQPTVLFLPSGEKYKRLAQVEQLAEQLSAACADRRTTLLAFGGGVIGDVTGFLAAIYMRGIDYIQIPTTFLSQVDSSVGGKTGVNLKTGKNLIGAFYPPKAVHIDIEFLKTLPQNELRAGLFESLKAGLIRDRALFTLMESERAAILAADSVLIEKVITASVRMKAKVVGEDERESGLRMILNFGHTIGHAIETVAGFGALLHGEAVGWGMIAALEISRIHGLAEKEHARAVATVRAYGLTALPTMSVDKLLTATARDKKNSSGMRSFILLKAIGKAYVSTSVTIENLRSGMEAILQPAKR